MSIGVVHSFSHSQNYVYFPTILTLDVCRQGGQIAPNTLHAHPHHHDHAHHPHHPHAHLISAERRQGGQIASNTPK